MSSFRRRNERPLLGGVCALAVLLALGPSPATARDNSGDRHKAKKVSERISKEPFGAIPKGPLQIFISIEQQQLHLYSDGTHVADALVATGVPGHATPMGVFSVIEKDRFHHSNIYSNAPMPYMQRITWSGVAMHQGPGVGHVASHGCIRMPQEFAARLWVLTRLGVRVVIARPELKPTDFADSHLFVHKDPPSPTAAAPAPVEAIKTAQTIDKNLTTDAVAAPLSAVPTTPARQSAPPQDPALLSKPSAFDLGLIKQAKDVAIGVAAGLDAGDATKAADGTENSPDATASDPTSTAAPKREATDSAGENAPASTATVQQVRPTEPAPPAAAATDTAAPAASDAAGVAPAAEVEPVPVPLPKPAALVKAATGKNAPIAIFVSRRAGKIYVRQNFAPLFSATVAIERPEQPLGTHVFTAMEYLSGGSTLRWNVVSLPGEQPKLARHSDDERRSAKNAKEKRSRRSEEASNPAPPQTPAQALARIDIPQDVIEQISELIVPGSSLIVSDQGLGEETGEGTDFIVVTR